MDHGSIARGERLKSRFASAFLFVRNPQCTDVNSPIRDHTGGISQCTGVDHQVI